MFFKKNTDEIKTVIPQEMLELIDFFGTREKGNWRNS